MTMSHATAQHTTIPLWENEIPGSKTAPGYEEESEYDGNQLTGVSKVTVPELTVYEPKNPNGTAVIICPGGGYGFLAINKEGFKVAQWFAERGITGFVLKYRLPSDLIMEDKSVGPLQDAQRAMRLVREHAETYKLDLNKIGVMGFSAGGHLASSLSTLYDDEIYDADPELSAKPDFSILLYPVISMKEGVTHKGSRENLLGTDPSKSQVQHYSGEEAIDEDTPGAFIVHAQDDGAVPVQNSLDYFSSLTEKGVPAEIHIYETGGHGFGLGVEATSKSWTKALNLWLACQDLL